MRTLYKFGASWCAPCKAMDPLLDEITQFPVVRIDIEENSELTEKYQVRSVPTLVLIDEKGIPLAMRSGGLNRHQLQEFLRIGE